MTSLPRYSLAAAASRVGKAYAAVHRAGGPLYSHCNSLTGRHRETSPLQPLPATAPPAASGRCAPTQPLLQPHRSPRPPAEEPSLASIPSSLAPPTSVTDRARLPTRYPTYHHHALGLGHPRSKLEVHESTTSTPLLSHRVVRSTTQWHKNPHPAARAPCTTHVVVYGMCSTRMSYTYSCTWTGCSTRGLVC